VTEGDRHSKTEQPELIADEVERARREAENGIRQFNLALEYIRTHVKDPDRPFRLRSGLILQLHEAALKGIHLFAGTFRNTPVAIGGSKHTPPEAFLVSDEVQDLCSYVNESWASRSAVHLAAYVLWKLNWIHPFADGNGRTSRAVSYVVMSIKLDSILPGTPSIPDQIAEDKRPYYDALEKADAIWLETGNVDVSALEQMLEGMLARQLLNATEEAMGPDREATQGSKG
jgi:Fic family protein